MVEKPDFVEELSIALNLHPKIMPLGSQSKAERAKRGKTARKWTKMNKKRKMNVLPQKKTKKLKTKHKKAKNKSVENKSAKRSVLTPAGQEGSPCQAEAEPAAGWRAHPIASMHDSGQCVVVMASCLEYLKTYISKRNLCVNAHWKYCRPLKCCMLYAYHFLTR